MQYAVCSATQYLQKIENTNQDFFVLSILLMAALFSYHLGLVALITTVLIAGSTMAYLYIQQQHAIDRIQSTLYNICLYC